MKKKIVVATMGTKGDLFPYLAISEQLKKNGHHITFATSLQYKPIVEDYDLIFKEMRPNIDYVTLAKFIMDSARGAEYVIKEITDKHIRDSYSDLEKISRNADLLISHTACFAGPMVAEKTGIPWISCVLSPNVFWSRFEPLVPHNLTFLRHLFFIGKPVNIIVKRLAKIASSNWTFDIIKLRKELNLDSAKNPLFEGLHSQNLVLALYSEFYNAKKLDYPDQTRITGFPVWKDNSSEYERKEFDTFIEKHPNPVIFTLGTSAVYCENNFFNHAVEACLKLDVPAILLTGSLNGSLKEKYATNDSICQFSYLPHQEVFQHAKMIVHHGGMGTIGHVLRAGVPSLTIPFSHDQPDNGYRLKRMGLGEVLERNLVNSSTLYKKIKKVLNNKHFHSNSRKIASKMHNENGTKNAVIEIEKFILNSH